MQGALNMTIKDFFKQVEALETNVVMEDVKLNASKDKLKALEQIQEESRNKLG